jgi:hypothetical protein
MKRNILLIVALFAGLGLVLFATSPGTTKEAAPSVISPAGSIALTVDDSYTEKEVSITADETMLEMLQALDANDSQMQLSTKEYTGLGTLVTGMYDKENGTSGQYWQYRVNDVMPQVGVDAYVLKNGENVEWFFAVSQE